MVTYLNPDNDENSKETLIADIFVDKYNLTEVTNSKIRKPNKYVFVSCPRRFGKTMAINMLSAYYGKGDSASLFENLKISKPADTAIKQIKEKRYRRIKWV